MSHLDDLDNARYFSFATFRRDGAVVATPVWFASIGQSYYVFTRGDAGKVKRLRHSSRVRIARCDMRGTVSGPWAETRATLVTDVDEEAAAYRALLARYGWQMRIANLFARLAGRISERRVIRVAHPGAGGAAC